MFPATAAIRPNRSLTTRLYGATPSSPPPRAKKALAPGRPPAGGERPSEQKSALRERDALSSRGLPRSTFGDGGLSFRVRNGTGRSPPPWSRSRGALPRGSLAAQGALRATLAVAQRFDWRTPTGRP